MVDFFERQDKARLNTIRLLPYFFLAVFLTAAAVYLLCIAIYAISLPILDAYAYVDDWVAGGGGEVRFLKRVWIPELFGWVVGLTLAVMVIGSCRKFLQLRKGGRVVALSLGGRLVEPNTRNTDERQLLNVVEEMAIASATVVPDVYVLDHENSINAFAAGHHANDTVIGVTHGCLRTLSRDELQGVIAHEYSHIINGDMRLNMRLAALVHGIFCITLVAYGMMMVGHERELEDKTILEIVTDLGRGAVGVLLAFIGFNGAFFGRVIKSAVCREREFLADAAAVQFTRYPDGLAGALKKAEAWASQRILLPAAEDLSHIFFNNVRDDDQLDFTSTHPRLTERVRRLNPSFAQVVTAPADPGNAKEKAAAEFESVLTLDEIVGQLAPTNEHLAYASRLMACLPARIKEAARDSSGCRALVYALMLSPEGTTRIAQLKDLKGEMATEVAALARLVDELGVQTKLPLVEISFPALRRLPAEEQRTFMRTVEALIHADQQTDIFELALLKTLRRHLNTTPAEREVRYTRIKPLGPACSVLLSMLAHAGHDTESETEKAFQQGGMALGLPADDLCLLEASDCDLSTIENALDEAGAASVEIKNLVLNGCLHAAASDGTMRIKEVELMRAIADAIGCAMPPALGLTAVAPRSAAA